MVLTLLFVYFCLLFTHVYCHGSSQGSSVSTNHNVDKNLKAPNEVYTGLSLGFRQRLKRKNSKEHQLASTATSKSKRIEDPNDLTALRLGNRQKSFKKEPSDVQFDHPHPHSVQLGPSAPISASQRITKIHQSQYRSASNSLKSQILSKPKVSKVRNQPQLKPTQQRSKSSSSGGGGSGDSGLDLSLRLGKRKLEEGVALKRRGEESNEHPSQQQMGAHQFHQSVANLAPLQRDMLRQQVRDQLQTQSGQMISFRQQTDGSVHFIHHPQNPHQFNQARVHLQGLGSGGVPNTIQQQLLQRQHSIRMATHQENSLRFIPSEQQLSPTNGRKRTAAQMLGGSSHQSPSPQQQAARLQEQNRALQYHQLQQPSHSTSRHLGTQDLLSRVGNSSPQHSPFSHSTSQDEPNLNLSLGSGHSLRNLRRKPVNSDLRLGLA